MLWKLHKAQPGDGARLGPLWEPWLGLRHDTAMDAGAMVDTCELLELVLWAQNRQTGEVSGMLLGSPSTSLMQEFRRRRECEVRLPVGSLPHEAGICAQRLRADALQ